MTKVKLKKGALDYFRQLARKTPLEIHAYLIGEIVSPTLVVVDKFAYPKRYEVQTPANVGWFGEDFIALKNRVEQAGKRIVGDIHSHPEWDAVMSPDDHRGAIIDALRVCGICSVYGGKTRVRFWVPESSLPCELIYK